MSAENPLAMPIIDEHGNIVVTPHQVLEQVVDNATRNEDQAQHNSAIMDEMLFLREETAKLRAELLAHPSNNDFTALQAQVANLCLTIQQSHTPMLKVHQPREFKDTQKDVREFVAHCELNFAAAPGLFSTDDRKIVFVASHLSAIAFKCYQALEGDPFSHSLTAFCHELLTAFDDGDLQSCFVTALRKLEQTGSIAEYTTSFEAHSIHTKYNDVALCDVYYFRLKDKLKDLITDAGRPSTLAKLKADTLKFDHRVMEHQREQPTSRAVSPPAPHSATMDVNALSTRPPKKSPSLSSSVICSAIRVQDTHPDPPDLQNRLLLPCRWSGPCLSPGNTSLFVDSGCFELTLMDTRFVSEHQIPTHPLVSPIPVFLADGGSSPAGFIMKEMVPLSLDIAGHLETLVFKVVHLRHPLMVGLLWLQRHNPTINWNPSSVVFSLQWCLSHCAKSSIKGDLSYTLCSSVSSVSLPLPLLLPTTPHNNSEWLPVSYCYIDTLTYCTFFRKARAANVFVCWINADGLSSSGIQPALISSVLTTKNYATSSIPLSENGIPLKYQALGKAFQTSLPGSPSDLPLH
jgi:hypothetical protein